MKGQKAAYGVKALGVIQRLSLKKIKNWKAEKHEHSAEGLGAE